MSLGRERIIFLDIDGVLDSMPFFKSQKYLKRRFWDNCDMSNMINRSNLFWVGLLCRLTKAKVVLSSTWKYGWNEDGSVKETEAGHNMIQTDKLFRKFGVNIISIIRKGKLKVSEDWELDEEAIKRWCEKERSSELADCSKREFILQYCRGTQIAEWIERNNYKGKYIVIDDDFQDIIFYKDLAKRLVKTSYYKKYDGFRFLHFAKGLRLLLSA